MARDETIFHELKVDALYEWVDAARRKRDMSWRQVAHLTGLPPSTFTRLKQGRKPSVDAFLTMCVFAELPELSLYRGARLVALFPKGKEEDRG